MRSAATTLPPGIRSWRDGRVLHEASRPYELVVIGCSMGGMHALGVIFSALPKEFPLPIVVVQHRYKTSNEGLPAYYSRHSDIHVVDASDKEWLRPGEAYLAPADYHLLVDRGADREGCRGELSLSADDAVAFSRPSIDVLFISAAEAFGASVIAVVLTGANADGARGAKRIKQSGGLVIVQDPATAEAPSMPKAAIEMARVDRILPLDRIGPFLVEVSRNTK
jgi:two-component system chemotaxis response regulator CheB